MKPFQFFPLRFFATPSRDFETHNREAIDFGLTGSPENRDLVLVDDAAVLQVDGFTEPSGNAVLFERADGVRFSYSHLADPFPWQALNQTLPAGTIIGQAGSSGRVRPVGAKVLHFVVRDADGNRIDPWPLMVNASQLGAMPSPTPPQAPEAPSSPGSPVAAVSTGGSSASGALAFLIFVLIRRWTQ